MARFVPQRLKLSANSEGSAVSGYLRRRTGGKAMTNSTKWKRCWFVLKDRVLYTYRASEDSVAIDTLPVLGWNVTILDQVRLEKKCFCFRHELKVSQQLDVCVIMLSALSSSLRLRINPL